MLGATVKIGGFIPRAVASTPTRSIPHILMGAGWAAPSAAIPKNNGHAIMADRKKLKSANGLYLGSTGSGKSFAAKRELLNVFLTHGIRPPA